MKLRDFIPRCARTWPGKPAFISGDEVRSWSEIDERSDRLAVALQDLGVGKGDVVATLGHEHIEKPETLFACLKIGAVRTGINWRYSTREMLHIIRDSDARALILQSNCLDPLEEHLEGLTSEDRHLIGFGGDHSLPYDYDSLIEESGSEPEWPELDEDDTCMIIYTSGTTGLPKGAQLTQRGFRQSIIQGVIGSGLNAEDVFLNVTPHAGITCVYTLMGLVNGMTTVLPDGDFKPEPFLQLAERHNVTFSVLVVTALRRVVQTQKNAGYDLSDFRLMGYGSETATPALLRSAKDVLDCQLLQYYGMTEVTAPWISILWDGDHERGLDDQPELLESCGRPTAFSDMAILDEQGHPLDSNERGEIAVRSETVMTGYLNLPDETDRTFSGEWYRTGDVGYHDEQGYFYLVDRKDFLIMTGAMKVYPSAVESVMDEHPDVAEVAVVGVPHPDWGEGVVAVVRLHSGGETSPEDLKSFCREELADFEVPKYIDVVDELPHGVTGKIDRHGLRERYRESPERLPWKPPQDED